MSTDTLSYAPLACTVLLGIVAALWLRTRSYRRDDDVVRRVPDPLRLVTMLVAAGALLAGPFYLRQPVVVLATYALALVWAAVLAFIDLEVRRLPDRLTLPAYGVAAVLLTACSAVTGDWPALLRALTCAGAAVAVYLVAALVSPGAEGLGLGDVKLAGVLGALLGWHGWLVAVLGLLSGFVAGGLVAIVLLVLRRADRRSSMPFGPAMLAGAYVWCLLGGVA